MEKTTNPRGVGLSVMCTELRQRILRVDLFTQGLFSDFLDSINHAGDLESDIQCFVGENKGCEYLDEFPEFELKNIIRRYYRSETFNPPNLSSPLS